jgi:hypothetical protein
MTYVIFPITYVTVEKQLLLWLCREHNICHSRKTAELMFERQFLITTNVLYLKF